MEHAITAKNLSNLYVTTTFNPQLFGHLRTEATSNYPNCIFTVSENLAHIMVPDEHNMDSNNEFKNYIDPEWRVERRKEGFVGHIFGCQVMCNPDLPDNMVIAIGHNADFTEYNSRMRVVAQQ